MSLVSADGPCSFPSNDSKQESKGLVECLDSCLSSPVACRGIQWDSQHQLCNSYSSPRPAKRQSGCVVFRRGCQTPSDIICMKTVYINNFRPGTLIPSVKEEMNCRILCTMWESCLGVTWYAQKDACEVHEELQDTTIGVSDYRDVMAVKDLKCSARCLTMMMNVKGKNYTKTSLCILEPCIDLLNDSQCRSVIWRGLQRSCSTELQSDNPELSSASNSVRIYKSNTCLKTDVCYRKTEGKMMDNGFLLSMDMSEEDCVAFCIRVSNCAALTFQSRICIVYRVMKRRRDTVANFHLYEITPCQDSKTYRSIYFRKKEENETNSTGEGKFVRWTGIDKTTGSDVRTGSDVGTLEELSVLECAVQCAGAKSCQALKHYRKGLKKSCALGPK